jgi:hypothetical protein
MQVQILSFKAQRIGCANVKSENTPAEKVLEKPKAEADHGSGVHRQTS